MGNELVLAQELALTTACLPLVRGARLVPGAGALPGLAWSRRRDVKRGSAGSPLLDPLT